MIVEPPVKTPGVRPLTVVEKDVSVTIEEMANRVVATREEHGPLLQQYHNVWYNAPHTWHYLHFLGVGMMKCPNDLWMYQEIIAETRPVNIIETGTYQGGSALWFAYLMDMLQIKGARVFTIDFEDHRRCQHPRITFLGGDSRDAAIRDAIVDEIEHDSLRCEKCGNCAAETDAGPDRAGDVCPVMHCDGILKVRRDLIGPLMISLDADHSADHVRQELELYAPLAQVGDYLIVEDTNISWGTPDDPSGDRGARGGIEDYLAHHPGEFVQDVLCERWLLTMHPGGWLRRVAECSHG